MCDTCVKNTLDNGFKTEYTKLENLIMDQEALHSYPKPIFREESKLADTPIIVPGIHITT